MQHYTAKIQKGGRVTIPAPIRRLLNLKAGDLLRIEYNRGRIICQPLK